MTLAERLKQLRTERDMSVAELSAQAELSKPYIWQIEDGRRKNPSGEKLYRLAAALGTTVADLMGAPAGIPQDALEDAPESLREFMCRKRKALGLRQEDLEMLKHIHYRGKRPEDADAYELVFRLLRRLLG